MDVSSDDKLEWKVVWADIYQADFIERSFEVQFPPVSSARMAFNGWKFQRGEEETYL